MIRTLIVEDDVMTAELHRRFTEQLRGFQVVGQAATGEQAIRLARELEPELVLLDIYLPDLGGIDVLRLLRSTGAAPSDVIVLTAAKDIHIVREAMHLGAVHYLLKPFTFRTFRERLDGYAGAKQRLDSVAEVRQQDIDHFFGMLRTIGEDSLPKGISAPTLTLLADQLQRAGTGMSAMELATTMGVSQGVTRRYLKFLAGTGHVDLSLRYGAGRPEHIYRWSSNIATGPTGE
ncbi:MAG: response regulator [Sciscionella sp.]